MAKYALTIHSSGQAGPDGLESLKEHMRRIFLLIEQGDKHLLKFHQVDFENPDAVTSFEIRLEESAERR